MRYCIRRLAVCTVVLTGHLLVIALVIYASRSQHAPTVEWRLTAVDVTAATEPSTPPRPVQTRQIRRVPHLEQLTSSITTSTPTAAASGSNKGTSCATASLVARAIHESPEAMAALAALPTSLRTEADAVMLWAGAPQPETAPVVSILSPAKHPLEAIMKVIGATLISVPADCLAVENTGPQIIPVPEVGRTTMLVIGSGVWRWSSLVNRADGAELIVENIQTGALSMLAPTPTGN